MYFRNMFFTRCSEVALGYKCNNGKLLFLSKHHFFNKTWLKIAHNITTNTSFYKTNLSLNHFSIYTYLSAPNPPPPGTAVVACETNVILTPRFNFQISYICYLYSNAHTRIRFISLFILYRIKVLLD